MVVVFTKSAVHVYTCNGKFVAAAPIQYPIERASTFTTYKGFDYVLIKLRNGKILYFEAAYPDKLIDVNLKIASEFSSATFSDIIASIITIDTNGKVLSTPVND